MARPKPWIARLPLIVERLRDPSAVEVLSRKDVETLFSIGRSAALELMEVVGLAPESNGHGLVTRGKLLDYLTYGPEAQAAEQEARRRHNLAVKLKAAGEDQQLRRVQIPVTSADEWCTLNDLPNVSIEPGMLKVAFSSPEELAADLYRLAKAMGDWDRFEKLCGLGELKKGAER